VVQRLKFYCYLVCYLCGNDLTGGWLEELTLAPGGLDGGTGRLGKGVCLNGNVLGGELVASHHNLVGVELTLGNRLGFLERVEGAGGSGRDVVEAVQLDQVVFLLGVAGPHGPPGELGQPAVEGGLSSLESRPGGPTGAGLLPAHSESAGGALAGGDSASLAGLLLAGSGGGAEGIEGEFEALDVVDGGLVGGAAFPVVEFHGEVGARDGRRWDRREAGSGEGRKGICCCGSNGNAA